jgi:hypothetical protein
LCCTFSSVAGFKVSQPPRCSLGFIFRFHFSVSSPTQIDSSSIFLSTQVFPVSCSVFSWSCFARTLCWPAARSCAWSARKDCIIRALQEEHTRIWPPRACAHGQVPLFRARLQGWLFSLFLAARVRLCTGVQAVRSHPARFISVALFILTAILFFWFLPSAGSRSI